MIFGRRFIPGLLALGLLLPEAFAADPNLARNLAATCANCHGTDGKAVAGAGIDPLAGVPKEITLQKLREFRSGQRTATIMDQIVKGYSEAQLDLIASYFANRP